jgi:hypothetical protein
MQIRPTWDCVTELGLAPGRTIVVPAYPIQPSGAQNVHDRLLGRLRAGVDITVCAEAIFTPASITDRWKFFLRTNVMKTAAIAQSGSAWLFHPGWLPSPVTPSPLPAATFLTRASTECVECFLCKCQWHLPIASPKMSLSRVIRIVETATQTSKNLQAVLNRRTT